MTISEDMVWENTNLVTLSGFHKIAKVVIGGWQTAACSHAQTLKEHIVRYGSNPGAGRAHCHPKWL